MTEGRSVPLAGVVGCPVAHSRSPRLHGHWLDRYAIPGTYVPMEVAPEHLAEVVRCLPKAGFVGLNVTIPHKVRVLELADSMTDRASLIGAANTLTFRPDGRLEADNTDGYGFDANMRRSVPGWTAGRGPAAVIGAGGAARAVVAALHEAGAPEIRIANRTRARADELRDMLDGRIPLAVHDWAEAGAMLEGAATVVNATSLGMAGGPELDVPLDGLSGDAVAADLVYTPLSTAFLRAAAARGCAAVDGLGMLLHQAVPGFESWFGRTPEVDDELRAAVLR